MHFITVSLGYHPDVPGGAWRVAAAQAVGLAARGHTVQVVTADPDGNRPRLELRDGVGLARFPQQRGHFLANWRAGNRAAAALIRERLAAAKESPLILQHHAYLEPAVATAPAKVLHTYHGPWAAEHRFAMHTDTRRGPRRWFHLMVQAVMHRVERRALRRANRLLVLSQHFAGELKRWHGARLPPVEVVPGGVDFNSFHPSADRAAVRKAWDLEPEDFLVVALRRLDPRMGLDVLIAAFGDVLPDVPRAHLWLTGRGSAEPALRSQIRQSGMESRVRLLGTLEEADVPRLLNAADVAVVPSLGLEGFGLATLEALACGTPVLGSRAGATPELLEPLDPTLLFSAGDREALARRLRQALTHPTSLPSRERCAEYARAHFSWAPQIEACERIAQELLEGPTG